MKVQSAFAQKIDEEKMERDIEVAENVLGTLIKQQFEKQKMFFPLGNQEELSAWVWCHFLFPADYTTPLFLHCRAMIIYYGRTSVYRALNVNYSHNYQNEENGLTENEPRS